MSVQALQLHCIAEKNDKKQQKCLCRHMTQCCLHCSSSAVFDKKQTSFVTSCEFRTERTVPESEHRRIKPS